ncbi:ATP-binding protein [Microbacterium sp. KKR3/1]|uniref:ATP-binding protein n=1 Tax=Microbacterium sp. KKR3/1 TaxID=2904241 RepID=UPI001E641FF9|nr:ATP-binding protein [Microbacterium sp. KKR3/1]MCE0507434.1 ATP-binding protein [Microbacterium sp. KKR3/1]
MSSEDVFESALVEPDKNLFIQMLTRDVELIPAILDLWDNSVDGALRFVTLDGDDRFIDKSLDGFHIDITVNPDSFSIVDNCGGIPLMTARDYAFRLGRNKDAPTVDGAVGSFGVGMKRTLFKMGDNFRVESESIEGAFALEVDVPKWAALDEDVWVFPFESADAAAIVTDPKQASTSIKVWNPQPTVAAQFAEDGFIARLKHELEIRRPEAFDLGIVTRLNGTKLTPRRAQLKSSSDFRPLVRRFRTPEDVRVEIHAGLVGGAKESQITPDDEGDADKFMGHDDAGWYVLANGRVLLAADKTRLTGWGDDTARYHPQFRNFRGYVDIRSNDARNLPWNTSKTGVDESSRVWKLIYGAMRTALAEVQALASRLKEDRRAFLETEVKSSLIQAYEKARERPIEEISPKQESTLNYPKQEVQTRKLKTIRFSVDTERFDTVAEALGLDNPQQLGRALFDYYWRLEIDD